MRARGGGGRGGEQRRRAGLSLDSRRLHWNIVEGELKQVLPSHQKATGLYGNVCVQ